MRPFIGTLVLLAGCKYVDQPSKVAALEKRLDEVAGAVAELTGEPVGQPGSKPAAPDDRGDRDRGKGAGSARADHSRKKRPADRDARDQERAESPGDRGGSASRAGHGDGDRATAAAPAAPPASPHPDVHWSYEGDHGPPGWGGLDPAFATCASGTSQSPIDILPRPGSAPEVFLVYRATTGEVVDNGHTLQVNLDPGSFAIVDGARFELMQFHVHTPSEHTIAGDAFPLEVHLVHKDKAGSLAVVGVLFAEGEPSAAMKPVWKAAPRASGRARLKKPFDPSAFLPRDLAARRYDGSLTTPPCTEGVRWIVLKRTRTEDGARIAAFRQRFGNNARPAQQLGEREVQ